MAKDRGEPARKSVEPGKGSEIAKRIEAAPASERAKSFGPDVPIVAGPLARGMQIDCYLLQDRLGAGFSAEVWSASVQQVPPGTELVRDQEVALKFYHAYAMALPDQVFRIEREYRIAQSIRHPHLIRIFEFVLASPRPHHNFLVMDIARGVSLRKLAESRALTTRQIMTVLRQVLSALDALHGAGALHRDIKPGNITVEVDGATVHSTLLDLGIVNITYEKGLTGVSHFLGSKHWAPIEQLLGESLDEQSDLYGVGAVAFHALTGQVPYAESATEAAVAVRMGSEPLVLPPVADLPPDVARMIDACLSYRRENRPRSARECHAILERHA